MLGRQVSYHSKLLSYSLQARVHGCQTGQLQQYLDGQQCDQTIDDKVAQICFLCFSKQPQKSHKYLGYFCKKICTQSDSEIEQSGHTGRQFFQVDSKQMIFCPVMTGYLLRSNVDAGSFNHKIILQGPSWSVCSSSTPTI